jgi:hypothetical protein
MLQATAPGIQIDPAWAITAISGVIGTLATVIAYLYRAQITDLKAQIDFLKDESKHKDDRMIDQLNRVADVQDRGLSLVEAERRRK